MTDLSEFLTQPEGKRAILQRSHLDLICQLSDNKVFFGVYHDSTATKAT